MKYTLSLLILIAFSSFAQQKDSLKVFQSLKEVPEKYKLKHFGIKGKVKSFEESFGMLNDESGMIYEFNENGNLLKISNSKKIIKREYFYDVKGKLKSYKYKNRLIEVELDEDENIIIQHVYKKDRDTVTVENTYNKDGYWTSQTHIETNQKMLEHKYDENNKMTEIITYQDGKLSSTIKLTYKYFKKFIQVCHNTTYINDEVFIQNYFYIDYFGNELYGFSIDENNPSQHQINEFFAVYKLDQHKNWFKTNVFGGEIGSRYFTYY